MNPGSSPLARGLHHRPTHILQYRRIIPARAGFTNRGRWTPMECSDHPRSRGVYPSTGRRGGPRRWIIPARAGFTRSTCPSRDSCPDHPRSRGVYKGPLMSNTELVGSSPLARGLLMSKGIVDSFKGIIPARAGFTPRHSNEKSWPTDHPRSRGVYFTML